MFNRQNRISLGNIPGLRGYFRVLVLLFAVLATGCTGQLQTKISGNLNQLSRQQVVAVLPPELTGDGQKDAGALFRQSLYANLQHAKFRLMERHVVDSLLHQNRLMKPADLKSMSPFRLGEVLGADAVVITRINRVERSYLVLHSSIEVDISVEMVDTRTGEILWRAEQTESDFQGLGKIPTGMSSAVLAPIQFVTNKLNLHRITHEMVTKLTNLVKRPERAKQEETFDQTVIAKAARKDLARRETNQKLEPRKVVVATVAENKMKGLNKTGIEKPQGIVNKLEALQKNKSQRTPQKPARINKGSGSTTVEQLEALKKQPKKRVPLWDVAEVTPRQKVRAASRYRGGSPGEQLASIQRPVAGPARVSTARKPVQKARPQVKKLQQVRVASIKPPPSGVLYTLQVGAYKTKAFAERALKSLISKGHDAFVSWFRKDDEKIYRVHVDKYKDKSSALQASRELKANENIPSILTTVRPK